MTNMSDDELEQLMSEADTDTSRYGHEVLLNPDKLIAAFEVATDLEDRLELALFAESLSFNNETRPILIKHLWKLIKERITSRDPKEEVVIGAAIRKLYTGLPVDRFDEIVQFYDMDISDYILMSLQLGLINRTFWDTEAVSKANCPKLCEKLYNLVVTHCPKEIANNTKNGSIVRNGVLALHLLGRDCTDLLDLLKNTSQNWLYELSRDSIPRHLEVCNDLHHYFPPVELC